MPPGGSFEDTGGGAGISDTGGFCGCLSGFIRNTGYDNGPVEIMVVGSAAKSNGECNGGPNGSTSCLVVTTPPDEINREELDAKFAELVVSYTWILV